MVPSCCSAIHEYIKSQELTLKSQVKTRDSQLGFESKQLIMSSSPNVMLFKNINIIVTPSARFFFISLYLWLCLFYAYCIWFGLVNHRICNRNLVACFQPWSAVWPSMLFHSVWERHQLSESEFRSASVLVLHLQSSSTLHVHWTWSVFPVSLTVCLLYLWTGSWGSVVIL